MSKSKISPNVIYGVGKVDLVYISGVSGLETLSGSYLETYLKVSNYATSSSLFFRVMIFIFNAANLCFKLIVDLVLAVPLSDLKTKLRVLAMLGAIILGVRPCAGEVSLCGASKLTEFVD